MQLKHVFSFLPTKNVLNIKALKTTTTNNPLLPHLLIQSLRKTNVMMIIEIILITDQTVQPSRQQTVQVNFH